MAAAYLLQGKYFSSCLTVKVHFQYNCEVFFSLKISYI